MTLKPQDSLAHYRLVEVLGQGGMGVVSAQNQHTLRRDDSRGVEFEAGLEGACRFGGAGAGSTRYPATSRGLSIRSPGIRGLLYNVRRALALPRTTSARNTRQQSCWYGRFPAAVYL